MVSEVLNPCSFQRRQTRERHTWKRSDIEPVAWKKMSTEQRGTEKLPGQAGPFRGGRALPRAALAVGKAPCGVAGSSETRML